MPNITLSIPEDMHKEMKKHREIRWSEIARDALERKIRRLNDLEWMDKVLSKSKLTEKDAEEIGNKIKKGIAKRFELIK